MDLDLLKVVGEALPVVTDIVGAVGGMLQNNPEEAVTVATGAVVAKAGMSIPTIIAYFKGELKQKAIKDGEKKANWVLKKAKALKNIFLKEVADAVLTYSDGFAEGYGDTLKK